MAQQRQRKLDAFLFLARLLLLCLLEHLLDDLLLLNQEGSDDTISHAVAASRATVCALHGLLWSGGGGIFSGSESWDLLDGRITLLANLFLSFHCGLISVSLQT